MVTLQENINKPYERPNKVTGTVIDVQKEVSQKFNTNQYKLTLEGVRGDKGVEQFTLEWYPIPKDTIPEKDEMILRDTTLGQLCMHIGELTNARLVTIENSVNWLKGKNFTFELLKMPNPRAKSRYMPIKQIQ